MKDLLRNERFFESWIQGLLKMHFTSPGYMRNTYAQPSITCCKNLLQTRMHSIRMRTACSSSCPGVSTRHPPGSRLPRSRSPRSKHPPAARHAGIAHPPLQDMLGYQLQCMLGYFPPWTEWQTGVKILPFPQTSFAGGKYFGLNLMESVD